MRAINPWINFNGNAEETMTFYKSVFGGEFSRVVRMRDLAGPEFPVADEDAEKLMLVALPIGEGSELIANDVPASMGTVSERENRSKIDLKTENSPEAERIFDALAAGGEIEVPFGESPWGTRFGMLRDRYGIEWIVETADTQ